MIVVISGTNRPGSNTRRVARLVEGGLRQLGRDTELLDLQRLPAELFDAASYATKPAAFAPFQEAILGAAGILVVVPEYNGSFPGVLKYFIDMLAFPESLVGKPVGFIGLAAGEWGGLRAVEQLEVIFHYRNAHLYGRRVFLKGVLEQMDDAGRLRDEDLRLRLDEMVTGFSDFCERLG